MWKIMATITLLSAVALTLYLPLSSPAGVFNTPDENANHFFAQLYARRGELRVEEPLNARVDNAIHPRGVNVIQGFLVPESFLGLPLLYGAVKAALDSEWLPALFVAVFTLFAIYALDQLFLYFFERKVARLALLLILTLPVFFYWLGRPYMHTILFLDFLALGWWIIVRGSTLWITVSGILLGGALTLRTSEVAWVGVVTVLLVYTNTPVAAGLQPARKLKLAATIAKVALGAALVLIPLLFLNQDLYGSAFGTGYSMTESNLIAEEGAVPQLARASFASQLLFPFGFHPFAALGRFAKYAFGGMWWYVAPMVLGAIILLFRHSEPRRDGRGEESHTVQSGTRKVSGGDEISPLATLGRNDELWRGYTIVWFMISLYLILSYGSFNAEIFADPKHPLTASVGAPYLRYWLPIFVFGAPLAAKFFVFLYSVILRPKAEEPALSLSKGSPTNVGSRIRAGFFAPLRFAQNDGLIVVGVILAVFLTLRTVVWAGPESWHGIQENLWNFAEARERIVRATPDNAVFFVPRWTDRIYFSARRVIVDAEGKDVIDIIKTLHGEGAPVFWHRGRGEIKLEPELSDAGLKLTRRFDVDPKGKVYEIRITND